MQQEFETKVLDINVPEIIEKLEAIWATLKQPEIAMRRRVFNIKEDDEKGQGMRMRLRQIGNKTTLTYKERNGNDIWSTKEMEIWIENFEDMEAMLLNLQWNKSLYQENKRSIYMLNDVEICIDSRPKIPTYLEIEGPNVESVKTVLQQLWLEGKDEGDIWVIETYRKYWLDLHSFKELKFEE